MWGFDKACYQEQVFSKWQLLSLLHLLFSVLTEVALQMENQTCKKDNLDVKTNPEYQDKNDEAQISIFIPLINTYWTFTYQVVC